RRGELIDALDLIDRLLERLRDAGFDLLDRRSLQDRRDEGVGDVDVRVEAHAEAGVRDRPEHDEDEDEHRREDRAADAGFGESHHERCSALRSSESRAWTGAPSTRRPSALVATRSPGRRPDTISTRGPHRIPVPTSPLPGAPPPAP